MLEQYEAKKIKITKQLFHLISPTIGSQDSILFIKLFLDKFYTDIPAKSFKEKSPIDFELLQNAI